MVSLLEVAQSSGRSRQNLRRLARDGKISARKLGRDWVVPTEVARQLHERKRPGRPLSATNAWGLLALLSGERPTWVDARIRFRLNRYLQSPERVQQLLELSELRADVHTLWLPTEDLRELSQEAGLVQTGLAAAGPPDFDLFYFEPVVDAYLDVRRLKAVLRRYQPLLNTQVSNVVLRVPSHPWVLSHHGAAPEAVVAADLIDEPDERARHAGRDALARLLNHD